jgi:hypothetical protein
MLATSEWSRTAELLYYGADPRLRFRALSGADAVPGAVLAQRLARVDNRAAIDSTVAALRAALDRPPDQPELCTRGGQVRTELVGRFLFVTRVGTAPFVLKAWGAALNDYVQALANRFGMPVPSNVITVHLARCPADARLIAQEVHGLDFDEKAIAGYSVQEDMSLLAIWGGYMPGKPGSSDNEAMRTIRHELAHLMLHEWFGDAPAWLDEGLAQYLGVTSDGPEAGRTTVLHSRWGPLPDLAQVIAPPPPVDDEHCVTIAQRMMSADAARMFLAYVDAEPKRLQRLMQAIRAYVPGDGPPISDRELIERALGAPLADLDIAYRKASIVKIDDSLFHDGSGDICPG